MDSMCWSRLVLKPPSRIENTSVAASCATNILAVDVWLLTRSVVVEPEFAPVIAA